MTPLAQRLVDTRKARGYSQGKLARLAGMHQTQLAHTESGKYAPTVANLTRLANVLRVSLDYLAGRIDTPVDTHVDRSSADLLAQCTRLTPAQCAAVQQLIVVMAGERTHGDD